MMTLALLFAWFLMLVSPTPQTQPPSDCARYFHKACHNWKIATWRPVLVQYGPVEKHKPAATHFSDGFVYEGQRPHGEDWPDLEGRPADGTPYVYGNAGPPRGTAVYDYAHRIAFYSEGCCSWHSTTLAADIGEPPVRVVNRSLTQVHTVKGISLGQTPRDVEAIYGKTTLWPVPSHPGMMMLLYMYRRNAQCGQNQTFVFKHGRLIYIDLSDAC